MAGTPLAVADLVKVTMNVLQKDQVGVMDFAYRVTAVAGTSLTPQALADNRRDMVTGLFGDLFPENCLFNGLAVSVIDPDTGRVLSSVKALDNVTEGTDATGAVPANVAGVIRKVTSFPGPANRGRVYWPFLPVGALTDEGEWSLVAMADEVLFLNLAFGGGVIGAGGNTVTLQQVLIHRPPGPLPQVLTITDVDSFQGSGKLGTQKRRGDYGRPNNGI